jgi:hypothetical protein
MHAIRKVFLFHAGKVFLFHAGKVMAVRFWGKFSMIQVLSNAHSEADVPVNGCS